MLAAGIYLPPSPFEAWFISLAHEPRDLEAAAAAARQVWSTRLAALPALSPTLLKGIIY